MAPTCDSVELLLPGVDSAALGRARSVVQFLRLLSNDATSIRAGAVGVGLDEARGELEIHDRSRVEGALCDLLRHHLQALSTSGSFLAGSGGGEVSLSYDAAWRVLDEFRDERPRLAGVPAPGEPALLVASRMLASLEELGASRSTVCLWRARFAHLSDGPRAAEKILCAELSSVEADDPEPRPGVPMALPGRRALIACVAECLLERGAVREAREWLSEHAEAVEGDSRLRQLLSWSRLCLGDYAAAKGVLVGLPPGSGVLPLGLVELRAHRPEWLPCLSGRAPAARSRSDDVRREAPKIRDRGEIGATVLGVIVLGPGGEVSPLLLDVAPGLREWTDAWLGELDGACSVPGAREHELVVSARSIVVHREGDRPIQGALGRGATRALALAPILDAEGEVAGWLHVECEHHLLPDAERLAALTEAWRGDVRASRDGAHEEGSARKEGAAPPRALSCVEAGGEFAAAGVFEDLVAELAIKTVQRRWWGFVHEAGETRLVASGGEAAGLAASAGGGGRALTRAIATRGRVSFDEPDPRLALDERTGSGTVLPLSVGGRLCGLLAIESVRRRDFGETEWARHAETAQHFGLALRLARFRGWHRERFGFDVWFDARRGDFRDFALHLLAAARSRSPVVISGPMGAGKRILSLWVHFESRSREGAVRFIECGSPIARGNLGDWLASAGEGSLVLEDVERLEPERQEELLRFLEGRSRGEGSPDPDPEAPPARILATTSLGLREAVEAGRMRNDLAHRLDRLQFKVPALVERREDILPLVACLTRRFSREEGVREPGYDDDALAFLWRQRWDGNVRELESFVYKLVLLARVDGTRGVPVVGADLVREMGGRFSMKLVRRIPSRHPLPSDLIAALRVTRMPGGRINKTRAALYLGWDPDTVVARMKDCGIGDEIRDEDVWTSPVDEPAEESS